MKLQDNNNTCKSKYERVNGEYWLAVVEGRADRPHYLTRVLRGVGVGDGGGEQEHGDHHDHGQDPGGDGDNAADERGAEGRSGDGMTDGDIAVRGENHQEQGAGDLVDGGGDQVQGAHGAAKRPLLDNHHCNQEWKTWTIKLNCIDHYSLNHKLT